MTDKLDLAEEIAALRQTVRAQAVMLKQVMGEIERFTPLIERPHLRLEEIEVESKDTRLRLQILENWQLDISEWQRAVDMLSVVNSPANDNNSDEFRMGVIAQKARLINEIESVIKRHDKIGLKNSEIWRFLSDLAAVLNYHRRGLVEGARNG